MDERQDDAAREAARLVALGAADLASAIRRAGEAARCAAPSRKRVWAHLRAMTQQELGLEGYALLVRRVLEVAEEVMTALETTDGGPTRLVGRVARGEVDGGATVHVRVYTPTDIGAIAAHLAECGYAEPTFETARTRRGRLSRLRFDEDGIEVVITRCPTDALAEADTDLFSGRRTTALSLEDLRLRLAEDSSA